MNKEFVDKIIKLRDSGVDLFYNSSGSVEAYKLGVKHLSSAPSFDYGVIVFRTDFKSFLDKEITIVDFDKETIVSKTVYVEIIPLKTY